MSTYPEHERLQHVKEKSQICGEFLDWLKEVKQFDLVLIDENGITWVPGDSTQSLLAEFFGISLTNIDNEKRAMLDALRAGQ